jgi:hypothetical protein
MMHSFYSASTIPRSEEDFYNRMPEIALVEIPPKLLFDYRYRASKVQDFSFVIDDLIDDCMQRTMEEGSAEESLEEWFDEICADLMAEGWMYSAAMDYMNTIGELFTYLKQELGVLYTPSGSHYYAMHGWLDGTTVILKKRPYVG